jgi:hypothetical protein
MFNGHEQWKMTENKTKQNKQSNKQKHGNFAGCADKSFLFLSIENGGLPGSPCLIFTVIENNDTTTGFPYYSARFVAIGQLAIGTNCSL